MSQKSFYDKLLTPTHQYQSTQFDLVYNYAKICVKVYKVVIM